MKWNACIACLLLFLVSFSVWFSRWFRLEEENQSCYRACSCSWMCAYGGGGGPINSSQPRCQSCDVWWGYSCFLLAVGFMNFDHNFSVDFVLVSLQSMSCSEFFMQDYNPKLYEFGMISGGKFQDRTKPYRYPGCFGYADPCTFMTGMISWNHLYFSHHYVMKLLACLPLDY